jgi:hypothetical protein
MNNMRRSVLREILFNVVVISLLLIVVPITGVLNEEEGTKKEESVENNFMNFSTFDGIFIMANVPHIDPGSYTYRLNFNIQPFGSILYPNTSIGQVSESLEIYVNGKPTFVPKGAPFPSLDVTLTFTEGNANKYPFESYRDSTTVFALFTGNGTNIPIAFQYSTFLQGWSIVPNLNSRMDFVRVETWFLRSKTTKFFSIFINILMWVMSLSLLSLVMGIWIRKRRVETPILAFSAALMFALPALRNTQPGVPQIGCTADAVGFFWCMAIVSLSVLGVIWNYIIMYQKETISKASNTRRMDESSRTLMHSLSDQERD